MFYSWKKSGFEWKSSGHIKVSTIMRRISSTTLTFLESYFVIENCILILSRFSFVSLLLLHLVLSICCFVDIVGSTK